MLIPGPVTGVEHHAAYEHVAQIGQYNMFKMLKGVFRNVRAWERALLAKLGPEQLNTPRRQVTPRQVLKLLTIPPTCEEMSRPSLVFTNTFWVTL